MRIVRGRSNTFLLSLACPGFSLDWTVRLSRDDAQRAGFTDYQLDRLPLLDPMSDGPPVLAAPNRALPFYEPS